MNEFPHLSHTMEYAPKTDMEMLIDLYHKLGRINGGIEHLDGILNIDIHGNVQHPKTSAKDKDIDSARTKSNDKAVLSYYADCAIAASGCGATRGRRNREEAHFARR